MSGQDPADRPSMDVKLIQKLVRLMSRAELTEFEIDDRESGLKLRMKRGADVAASASPQIVPVPMGYPGGGLPSAAPSAPAAGEAPAAGGSHLPPGAEEILSPMVGTFYRSPTPDAAPFVEPGGRIEPESVICIIEAMKVMNEIKAELRGELIETLVENGEPVEFGQPLFLVKKG